MRIRIILAATLCGVSTRANAQFSSDFPGVPRATISISGSSQHRTSMSFTGYKVGGSGGGSDTLAGGFRLALGRSYRIGSGFEVSWDLTLLDGLLVDPPQPAAQATDVDGAAPPRNLYMRGLAGYAIRIGAKYRAIVSVDPNGYGYSIAFGGGFQPQLRPLYGIEKRGDSTRSGGQFSHDAVTSSATFSNNPFAALTATTIVAGMGSYRSKRLLGDVAAVIEKGPSRDVKGDPSPIRIPDEFSLRAGGAFRLTPGIAVGASYWGKGSAPWWDEVQVGTPGTPKQQTFGFLLQLGSNPESGMDVMYTTPTGDYAGSGRLYIRLRSTQ